MEDLESIELGAVNLKKHIENVRALGVPAVVAVNRFKTDSQAELELVRKIALEAGAYDAQVSEVWELGGEGGRELADAVVSAAESGRAVNGRRRRTCCTPRRCRSRTRSRRSPGRCMAPTASSYLPEAKRQIRQYTELGCDKLPICMAKTQYSLSDNAALKGRPSRLHVTIREVRAYTGAGFLTPIAGRDHDHARSAEQRGVPHDRPGRERRDRRAVLALQSSQVTERKSSLLAG